MNKFTFIASVCAALFFAACGDDSSSVEPSLEESSSSVVLSSSSSFSVISGLTGNLLTDSRDGQTYKTVTIGSQTWMAENLNYHIGKSYSYCYDNDVNNCAKYGLLYSWTAAKKACPRGWHLPTKAEFDTLLAAVGDDSTAGKMLKSTSGWNEKRDGSSGNGTDDYSFSALPAGNRNSNEHFYGEGNGAYFWSSTEENGGYAYVMDLNYIYDGANLGGSNVSNGFSVRCVKD